MSDADRNRVGLSGGATMAVTSSVLDSAPELTLAKRWETASDEQEPGFFRIIAISAALDGSVYVLDAGNMEVVRVSPDGDLLQRLGREGDGPGEFRRPTGLLVAGDTLFVLEVDRLHIFDRERAELIRTSAIHDSIRTVRGGRSASLPFVGRSTAGLVTIRRHTSERVVGRRGVHHDTFHVRTVSLADGRVSPPLVSLIAGEWYPRGKNAHVRQAGAGVPHVAITPDGVLAYTTGASYQIDLVDVNEGGVGSIQALMQPISIDDRELERLFDKWEAQSDGEGGRYLRTVPKPSFRAVLGRMIAGMSNELLVQRLDLGPLDVFNLQTGFIADHESRWDLWDRTAGLIGRLTMPPGFTPMALNGNHLYGVERNADDVPVVVSYEICCW